MYSRESFDRLRTAAKARERADTRWLALVSIGLGVGQLGFIRLAEASLARRTAVALEGALFLLYAALVLWLLWRLQLHKRTGAPRCPHCGAALQGLSERIATATGRCDRCGAQVLESALLG